MSSVATAPSSGAMSARLHPNEEMKRRLGDPHGQDGDGPGGVSGGFWPLVMIPREKAGLLCGLRYGQTWVRLWTLVPNQCPKGDVVGSHLPSLWASIPLFAREGQVVNDPCDPSFHVHCVEKNIQKVAWLSPAQRRSQPRLWGTGHFDSAL